MDDSIRDPEGSLGRETPAVEELDKAVLSRSVDGRLACPAALALASRFGLSPREVGRACDRLGIKISDCQLGCFGRGRSGK